MRRATGVSFSYSPLFAGRISAALYPTEAVASLTIAAARAGSGAAVAGCKILGLLRPASVSQGQLSGCQWEYDRPYKLVVYAEADGRCELRCCIRRRSALWM